LDAMLKWAEQRETLLSIEKGWETSGEKDEP
jgi:hypothetical protein